MLNHQRRGWGIEFIMRKCTWREQQKHTSTSTRRVCACVVAIARKEREEEKSLLHPSRLALIIHRSRLAQGFSYFLIVISMAAKSNALQPIPREQRVAADPT